MRFLIVGGSDAGISAALRARELDSDAEVTVLLEDDFPNYSICGLPFFLSGETPDWQSLAHRSEFPNISIHRRCRATRIDPNTKIVSAQNENREEVSFHYDKLLIATGASPSKATDRRVASPWRLPTAHHA